MKQRSAEGGLPFFGGGGHHGGFGGIARGPASLDAAATYLGLTEAELHTQLESGKTLAEIAKDKGKTVDGLKKALTADTKAKLDAAVKAGKLTQAQADELLARMTDHLDDLVNGTAAARARHRDGHGFGPRWACPAAPCRRARATSRPSRRLTRVEPTHLRRGRARARSPTVPRVLVAPERVAKARERPLAVRILERDDARGVALGDGGDDRPVGAVGLGCLARQHVVERPVGLGRVPEHVDQPRRGAAAGEPVQPVVEAPVRRQLPGDVAGRGRLATGVGGCLERVQVGGRRPSDAAARARRSRAAAGGDTPPRARPGRAR